MKVYPNEERTWIKKLDVRGCCRIRKQNKIYANMCCTVAFIDTDQKHVAFLCLGRDVLRTSIKMGSPDSSEPMT